MAVAGRALRRKAAGEAAVSELMPRRLLLDTNVWLWWQQNDKRLGARARRAVLAAAEVRLSAASVWEIAIKAALGKLTLPHNADVAAELLEGGFQSLSVDLVHAEDVRRLPALHRDPFDRMLVAQARTEGLTLVTADPQLAAYGISVLDATI